jgi:hypothetical protein
MSDPQPVHPSELQTCRRCGHLGGKREFQRMGEFGDYEACPRCRHTDSLYQNVSSNDGCFGMVLLAATLGTAGAGLALVGLLT